MDKKLLVGVELLDYMSKLINIADELANANTIAGEIKSILDSRDDSGKENIEDSVYEGKAKDTMQKYSENLYSHMGRLKLFYEKAAQYVTITYDTMYQSDEALAAWIKKGMK